MQGAWQGYEDSTWLHFLQQETDIVSVLEVESRDLLTSSSSEASGKTLGLAAEDVISSMPGRCHLLKYVTSVCSSVKVGFHLGDISAHYQGCGIIEIIEGGVAYTMPLKHMQKNSNHIESTGSYPPLPHPHQVMPSSCPCTGPPKSSQHPHFTCCGLGAAKYIFER